MFIAKIKNIFLFKGDIIIIPFHFAILATMNAVNTILSPRSSIISKHNLWQRCNDGRHLLEISDRLYWWISTPCVYRLCDMTRGLWMRAFRGIVVPQRSEHAKSDPTDRGGLALDGYFITLAKHRCLSGSLSLTRESGTELISSIRCLQSLAHPRN